MAENLEIVGERPVVHRPGRSAPRWLLRAWELLAPRLPRSVVRVAGRALLGLPRRSRARRWFVVGASLVAWDATARARYDLILPLWDPRCEWHWDATFTSLGFDAVYRGHAGVRRSLDAWTEIWTDRSYTVREVLDAGNTWVTRMTAHGRGVASGANTDADFTTVIRLDPLIVDFRNYVDDAEALREAGLPSPPA